MNDKGDQSGQQEQAAVTAFLSDPATHEGEPVERVDTHAALVFIAGERAYKVKRAVKYPYLDFSSLEKRRDTCLRELELNRATAPKLYLEVRPILRGADGGLGFGEPVQTRDEADRETGEVTEWVLVMRAFDQEGLFDRLARRGELTEARIADLAEAILAAHEKSEPVPATSPNRGGARGMAETAAENDEDFASRPDLFPPERHQALQDAVAQTLERVGPLLDRRQAEGLVRRCHGDLHLKNICLFEGEATLFDAIEFSEAIGCIDLLYDFAFLLMDLDHRGLAAEGNLLFNLYVQRRGEEAALAALPLFLSVRAAIRAKVAMAAEAAQSDETKKLAEREAARTYFAAALAYLRPPAPCLVAVGGLSGSGKSTLAKALAPPLGAAPGALLLRSDALRKLAFGVKPDEKLPPEAYSAAASDRVYAEMRRRCAGALAAGHAVILDAVHARPEERAAAESLAEEAGVPFLGLWLEAPPEILKARTADRHGDVSDATPDVVEKQLRYETGPIAWRHLSASGRPGEIAAEALSVLGEGLPGRLRPVDDKG